MRWGDFRRWPFARQIQDSYDFAAGIARDPEKIAFRSLALCSLDWIMRERLLDAEWQTSIPRLVADLPMAAASALPHRHADSRRLS